ncbi:hypothetical protein ACFW04_011767 [Cataglyphis niger]
MVAKLNTDQKQVFEKIINIVNSDNKSILRLYVSGKGGTEKIHRLLQLSIVHDCIPKYKQLSDHVLKVLQADLKDIILFFIMMKKIFFKGDSFESRLNELYNFIDNLPSDTVCLLLTCRMCDVLNDAILNRIVSKEILLIAKDTIECIPYVKKKVLRVFNKNLSKQMTIKIRAKVMIWRNIDTSLGLVNSSIATVISIIQDISTDYVEKIKLLLTSFTIRAYVIKKQFPLSLSYEITIHKSQGLNLQSAVMDIGNSVFNCGQVYVALLRVTSLKGNYLRILMHRYEIGMHNLNTYLIRQCLEEYCTSSTKRNASDFLIAFCKKYDCIRNLIEHQVTPIAKLVILLLIIMLLFRFILII